MKKGFTLIELLVVIAIIAILAAILFPVFAQARAKARQASCLSNVKQIALACLMYSDDYDETLPPGYIGTAASVLIASPGGYTTMSNTMADATLDYVKSTKVWHCPEDKQGTNGYSYSAPSLWYQNTGEGAVITWYGEAGTMAAIEQPADTIIVACAPFNPLANPLDGDHNPRRAYIDNNFDQTTGPSEDYISPGNVFNNSLTFDNSWGGLVLTEPENFFLASYGVNADQPWTILAHNGGSNFGYADGHAKWSKISATRTPVNQWTVSGTD